jgi:hypothetical protein
LLNFAATNSSDSTETGRFQADADIGVGPTDVAQLINGTFSVYNKTTGAEIGSPQQSNNWWNQYLPNGQTVSGSRAFNQRIVYDAAIGRWFAAGLDNPGGSGGNSFLVAVSSSSDPTGSWSAFKIASDASTSNYGDWPTLGFNKDDLFLAANIFTSGYSDSANSLSIPISSLTAATATTNGYARYANVSDSKQGSAFSLQQENDFDGTLSTGMMFDEAYTSGSFSGIRIWTQADGVNGATTAAPVYKGTVSLTAYAVPGTVSSYSNGSGTNGAPQPNGVTGLDESDGRFRPAFTLLGGHIWGCQDVNIKNGTYGTNVGIRWFEIDASSLTLMQQGTITNGSMSLINASIGVNSKGTVVIGCTGTSTTSFASSYAFIGSTSSGGTTTFGSPILLAQGKSTYDVPRATGANGWGYFASTVVDPSNSDHFWTTTEYVSATNVWTTQISEIATPEPSSAAALLLAGLYLTRRSRALHRP